MTKRLTLVGFAAVAVVWGPYVYAELVRKPLPAASQDAQPVVIEPSPVVYAPRPAEPMQLAAAPAAPAEQAVPEHVEQAAPAVEDTPQPSAASDETTVAAATDSHATELAALAAETEQATRVATAQPAQPPAAQPPAASEPARETAAAAEPEPTPAAAVPDDAREESARAAKEEDSAEKQRAEAKPKSGEHEEAPSPESLAPAFRSTFAREVRDAQWASSEEPRLAQLLSGAGVPPGAIAEVRCQSTVCRVALNSVDVQAVQQSPLYQLLYQRVRDEFGPMLGLDPASQTGEQHSAFYVLRKGYELEGARDSY